MCGRESENNHRRRNFVKIRKKLKKEMSRFQQYETHTAATTLLPPLLPFMLLSLGVTFVVLILYHTLVKNFFLQHQQQHIQKRIYDNDEDEDEDEDEDGISRSKKKRHQQRRRYYEDENDDGDEIVVERRRSNKKK